MENINIDTLISYASEYGLKILAAIAIFIIGKWLAKKISNILKRVLKKADVDQTLISFGGNIIYTILLAFVIIAALDQLGVETTSLAAIVAAAGLAIGLALQGSLSNLAAGVLIISFRPFKIGDFIDVAGVQGTVKEISIFTTILKTTDNKTVIIPNAGVTDGNITNFSTEKTRRVDMIFGIGYDDDIKKAKNIISDILAKDDRVLQEPETVIAIDALADSSVNFKVRPWVKNADYWDVHSDTHEAVKLAFDKEGISIPYPQRYLHVQDVK